jgi:hypothetical protein
MVETNQDLEDANGKSESSLDPGLWSEIFMGQAEVEENAKGGWALMCM